MLQSCQNIENTCIVYIVPESFNIIIYILHIKKSSKLHLHDMISKFWLKFTGKISDQKRAAWRMQDQHKGKNFKTSHGLGNSLLGKQLACKHEDQSLDQHPNKFLCLNGVKREFPEQSSKGLYHNQQVLASSK